MEGLASFLCHFWCKWRVFGFWLDKRSNLKTSLWARENYDDFFFFFFILFTEWLIVKIILKLTGNENNPQWESCFFYLNWHKLVQVEQAERDLIWSHGTELPPIHLPSQSWARPSCQSQRFITVLSKQITDQKTEHLNKPQHDKNSLKCTLHF